MTTSAPTSAVSETDVADSALWVTLPEVFVRFDGPEPTVIRFAAGEKREAGTWTDFYVQVASWLAVQGKIVEPVPLPAASGRFIVNHTPVHGIERFSRPYELPNGLWLEANGRPQLLLDRTILLLKMFGVDPETV